MTAAACWEAANGGLPPEVGSLLNSSGDSSLVGLSLLAALPEWQVALKGGDRPSSTDALALCTNAHGLCVVAVEAKVLEDFGPLVQEKRDSTCPASTILSCVLPHDGMLPVGRLSFWLLLPLFNSMFEGCGHVVEGCGGGQRGLRSGALSTVAAGAPQAHRPHVHSLPGAKRPAPRRPRSSSAAVSHFGRH